VLALCFRFRFRFRFQSCASCGGGLEVGGLYQIMGFAASGTMLDIHFCERWKVDSMSDSWLVGLGNNVQLDSAGSDS